MQLHRRRGDQPRIDARVLELCGELGQPWFGWLSLQSKADFHRNVGSWAFQDELDELSEKFIPYRVVLDIDREEDSYFLFEALQHYLRYLSAQDQQNQPELHSMRRLLDMVDAAWLNSANVTDRN
ncbi:hypothetical protein [Glutamicibacter mysorens]|uniref:hypothetical protein n=1 Tax=Glutamicibacter mysorens TaxID=257984 RepID=UPI001C3F2AEB|nr:hypothetical protein [Glutamicibacter mysorens]